jgi:hypothetical protein
VRSGAPGALVWLCGVALIGGVAYLATRDPGGAPPANGSGVAPEPTAATGPASSSPAAGEPARPAPEEPDAPPAVTVYLTNGRRVSGQLEQDDAEQVVVVVPQGRLTFPRRLVDRVEVEAAGRYALQEALSHALSGRHAQAEAAFRRAMDDRETAATARAAYQRYRAKLVHDAQEIAQAPEPARPRASPSPTPAARTPRPRSGWPPGRLDWESDDPDRAFARARDEGKAVLLYLGNLGCPHCAVMNREVWAKPEVAEAAKWVVPLALFRGQRLWDWQIHLDLRPYPRVIWLDGWGRLLPMEAEPRRAGGMVQAIKEAVRLVGGVKPPGAAEVPTALANLLPADARRTAADPYVMTRSRAWRQALLRAGPGRLGDLYGWGVQGDLPLLRRAVLLEGPSPKPDALLLRGLQDPHTFVRQAALEVGAKLGSKPLLREVQRQVEAGLAGKLGVDNWTNVFCDLLRFLGQVPDASSLPALKRVLSAYDPHFAAVSLSIGVAGTIYDRDPDRLRARVVDALRAGLHRPEVSQTTYTAWQATVYRRLLTQLCRVAGRPEPAMSTDAELRRALLEARR